MKRENAIKKIGIHFILFIFITALVITSGVLLSQFGPYKTKYSDNSFDFTSPVPSEIADNNNIILDQHSHTLFSDGVLTVEQNILWHIAHGFNACIITDHNTLDNKDVLAQMAEKYKNEIIIIQGMEWTTNRIHMNFLGLNNWSTDDFPIPSNPTDMEIQTAINEAHEQNAVVTVDHIPWSLYDADMKDHPSRQQLLDWGVDYIEVINENDFDDYSYEYWCNDTNGFGIISGTDMHQPDEVWGWTGLNVTEFTEEAVMEELRAKYNTTIYYLPEGADDYSTGGINIAYRLLEPLILVGEYFENFWDDSLDWTAILVFTAYMIGIFAVVEIIRIKKDDHENP
ncbi:MAG: hypothetical protein GF364_19410 [Candidatus Lokiarchaeota archaeon]|nr:hypothetical protein [Candidatus Lokiarchaeota archaeon]